LSFVKHNTNENFKKTELYQDYQKYYDNLIETKNLKARVDKLKIDLASFKNRKKDEKNTEKIEEIEITLNKAEKDLIRLFYEKISTIEQEKMLYFMLAYPQEVLLIKTNPTGNNDQEKEFLGYEFSNRRGHEGLKMFSDSEGNFTTKLYHETNRQDPTKASSYVYNAFLGNLPSVHESIRENIQRQKLYEIMKFDRVGFEKEINISFKKKDLIEVESKWELVRLEELTEVITKGTTPTTVGFSFYNEGVNFVKIESILENGAFIKEKFAHISEDCHLKLNRSQLKENDILLSIAGSFGRIAIVTKEILPANTNQAIAIIRLRPNKISLKYVLFILKSPFVYSQTLNLIKGIAQNNLSLEQVSNFKIPLPPKPIQEQIVNEMLELEAKENEWKENLEKIDINIENIINQLFQNNALKSAKVLSYFDINRTSINTAKIYGDNLFTYVDIDCVGKGTNKINFEQKISGKNAPSRAKRVAEDNSIILSTVRPYLKGFAYINKVPNDTIFSTGFAIIKSKDENTYHTLLLYYFFMYSAVLMKQMEDKMQKASYPSINKDDIDNFLIPSILSELQTQTVEHITNLEAQKQDIEQFLSTIQEQKEAILKKYL
jgi:type I restriction enzyme M protein